MSDFLTRLLASQRGELVAVQPRLPARFESALPNALSQNTSVLEENIEREAHVPAMQVQRPVRNVEPTPYRGSLNVPTAQEKFSTREMPARKFDETAALDVRVTRDADAIPSPETIARIQEPAQSTEITARISKAATAKSQNAAEPPRAAENENPPALQPKNAIVAQPIVRIARESSPQRDAVEHAPASAPTIRVTIGRIFVRAMQTSAPRESRRAPASPKLSLEDYLKARERGER